MNYDTWKSTAPDSDACTGKPHTCECPDCRQWRENYEPQQADGYRESPRRKNERTAMTIEQIACICHEVNRAYCLTLGDTSQPQWDHAPQWQKDSAMAGVQVILDKPDTTPEQSHEGWLAQKRADGWAYGPVKDAENKLHPCFVPYAELPKEQQTKDQLFGAVVRACMPSPVLA